MAWPLGLPFGQRNAGLKSMENTGFQVQRPCFVPGNTRVIDGLRGPNQVVLEGFDP